MAVTFKYAVLSLMRNRSIMVWALAFPIVLASCFMLMFQGLDDVAEKATVHAVIVEDAAYEETPELGQFIDAVSDDTDGVLNVTRTTSAQAAEALMGQEAPDGEEYVGYLTADADGLPVVHLSSVDRNDSANMMDAYQSIFVQLMDMYCSKREMVMQVAQSNPAALADPATLEVLFQSDDATTKVDVTKNAPKESVRYYFALLGMAALFGAQAALVAVCALLPNISALGARRALGGVSRTRALAGCILASWVVSFACLTVAYLYMRFVVGIDFGGRDLACLGVLAVSSLMATSFGALLGSIPKMPLGAKAGLLTGVVCFASLFAGLYGQPTMELADTVALACPASQYINPAVQVSQAMFSLMYYDSAGPCLMHVVILLAMTVVFFLVSVRFLGRQRYASI